MLGTARLLFTIDQAPACVAKGSFLHREHAVDAAASAPINKLWRATLLALLPTARWRLMEGREYIDM